MSNETNQPTAAANQPQPGNPDEPQVIVPDKVEVEVEDKSAAEVQRDVANWAAANEPS